ncbi:MAG: UDP-glucose/GDP-mannose dehydrogenase family protein [Verrucomicrobia bacterium]|nr:UDP-glucose/GDP-mannose dehydrogenase family protein [Verrucomicrobiota bacterium]
MNISIFGLGYVGAVTAGCLARQGHRIVGVDVHLQKVESFNAGIPPIIEPGLEDLLKTAKAKGLLRATVSCEEAINDTELSIVCVGTPSKVTGALDLSFVRGVVDQIGNALRKKTKSHALVMRSTMLPGSTQAITQELLSDLMAVRLLQVFYYPEFLRESTAVADFENPSLAVVGTRDGGKPSAELMKSLFGEKAAVVNWNTAEMVKYACNAFHATKITFANEIGRVGKQMGIDARAVMELLCQDTKLNLSPYYMKPGNPFGGSCLPKDVRALTNHARMNGVSLPMLDNLLPSNERHLQSLLSLITESGQSEVVILGMTFKSNTDDLRESAMVEVAQTLLGRGFKLRIYDPALNLAALVGANKRVIDSKMPHLASLLCPDLKTALGSQGLVVAAQKCAPVADLKQFITAQHHVVDVNGWPELRELPSKYEGFCW